MQNAGDDVERDGRPEVDDLRLFIASHGRSLLALFGAHAVDIADGPEGAQLVMHRSEESPEMTVQLPTSLTVRIGQRALLVTVDQARSPRASFDERPS